MMIASICSWHYLVFKLLFSSFGQGSCQVAFQFHLSLFPQECIVLLCIWSDHWIINVLDGYSDHSTQTYAIQGKFCPCSIKPHFYPGHAYCLVFPLKRLLCSYYWPFEICSFIVFCPLHLVNSKPKIALDIHFEDNKMKFLSDQNSRDLLKKITRINNLRILTSSCYAYVSRPISP